MIATAWNRGNYLPTGGGYGLSFKVSDLRRHFRRDWGTIRLLVREPNVWVEANIDKDCFWDDDPQIIDKSIGQWLLREGYARWEPYHPPKFYLTHLRLNEFRMVPYELPEGLPCHREKLNLGDWEEDQKISLEGRLTQRELAIRQRCQSLVKKLKDHFRDPATGLVACAVCRWTKPLAEFKGDIIHIHHHELLANAPEEGREITWEKAKQIFSPLCPTCHALIHATAEDRCYTVQEMKRLLGRE